MSNQPDPEVVEPDVAEAIRLIQSFRLPNQPDPEADQHSVGDQGSTSSASHGLIATILLWVVLIIIGIIVGPPLLAIALSAALAILAFVIACALGVIVLVIALLAIAVLLVLGGLFLVISLLIVAALVAQCLLVLFISVLTVAGLVARVYQFTRSGNALNKAIQLKYFIKSWIFVNMEIFFTLMLLSSVAIFPVLIYTPGLNHVMVLGLSLVSWIGIICMVFGLYMLSHVLCTVAHSLVPYIQLEHSESGISAPESVAEIITCLITWWAEIEVVKRIPAFQQHKILRLYTADWIKVALFAVIGYNCIRLFTRAVVLLLRRVCEALDPATNASIYKYIPLENLLPRNVVVYCANGLRRSLDFVFCLLMLLLIWGSYFGPRLNETAEARYILWFGTWTLVSLLIFSLLWLVKTCVALAWEAHALFYNNIDSAILEMGKQLHFLRLLCCKSFHITLEDEQRVVPQAVEQPALEFEEGNATTQPLLSASNSSNRDAGRDGFGHGLLKMVTAIMIPVPDLDVERCEGCGRTKKLVKDQRPRLRHNKVKDYFCKPNGWKPTMYDIQQAAQYLLAAKNELLQDNYASQVYDYVKNHSPRVTLNDLLKNLVDDENNPNGNDATNYENIANGNDMANDENNPNGGDMANDENNSNGDYLADHENNLNGNDVPNDENIANGNDLANDENNGNGNDVANAENVANGNAQASDEHNANSRGHDWAYFSRMVMAVAGNSHPEDTNSSATIPSKSIEQWMDTVREKSLFLADKIRSDKEMVDCLNEILGWLIIGLSFIIWLLLTKLATTQVFVLIASPLLAASFIFGETCKNLFQGLIFVYAVHPFAVGDYCVIGDRDTEMLVTSIGIWTTTFRTTVDSSHQSDVIYPNSELVRQKITNRRIKFDWLGKQSKRTEEISNRVNTDPQGSEDPSSSNSAPSQSINIGN